MLILTFMQDFLWNNYLAGRLYSLCYINDDLKFNVKTSSRRLKTSKVVHTSKAYATVLQKEDLSELNLWYKAIPCVPKFPSEIFAVSACVYFKQ